MRYILRSWAAAVAGLALAAVAGLPAAAAPANPRVVATASQASGGDASVTFITSGAISAGDVIVLVTAGDLNMPPVRANCAGGCAASFAGVSDYDRAWVEYQPSGRVAQAALKVFVAFAREDIPIGTQFQVAFAGKGGAKSVTAVAISSASQFGLNPTGSSPLNYASGTGTVIGWSCTTNCSIAADLMMLTASMIPGGGSDSYTEDAGWTFLHQNAAGAWPTIRLAYKSSGAGGTFSYGLTNGTSRSWYSGALLVK